MDTYVITAFVEETPQGYAFAHRQYPIGQRFQDLSLVFRLLNGVGSDVQYGFASTEGAVQEALQDHSLVNCVKAEVFTKTGWRKI
jgi:hypothetical protein